MTVKRTPASTQRLLGRLARTASEALLARLFGVLGLLAQWRRPAHSRQPAAQRILLLRFGLLGDAVLWIPALRAARRLFPTARLEAVVSTYQYAVLSRFTYVDHFIVRDTGHFTRPAAWLRPTTWRSFAALVRLLRRRRYDVVLSCYGRMGARLALLSGAPLRYGYRDEADPHVLTHALPGGRYQEPLHEAAYSVRVVSAAASAAQQGSADDMPADDLSLTFPLAAAERQRAADLLAGVPRGVPLVAIHPGAANGAAKRWLPECWAQVADTLAGEGAQIALLGSADERPLVECIVAAMRHPVLRLDGATRTPGELAAVLARCHVVAAGDTGPLHLAVALGRPVVAIHGPTDPQLTGPVPGARAYVLRTAIPCSPCYNLRVPADCPLGHTLCMRLLPAVQVVTAIRAMLGPHPPAPSPPCGEGVCGGG